MKMQLLWISISLVILFAPGFIIALLLRKGRADLNLASSIIFGLSISLIVYPLMGLLFNLLGLKFYPGVWLVIAIGIILFLLLITFFVYGNELKKLNLLEKLLSIDIFMTCSILFSVIVGASLIYFSSIFISSSDNFTEFYIPQPNSSISFDNDELKIPVEIHNNGNNTSEYCINVLLDGELNKILKTNQIPSGGRLSAELEINISYLNPRKVELVLHEACLENQTLELQIWLQQ